MSREHVSLTVLFADISRSTQLYEILGDLPAQKLVADCLSLLSEVTVKYQGNVIKTIGDEVMCTFPDAELAAKAAKAMHRTLDEMPVSQGQGMSAPNIRVGLHLGQVILEGDDVFGDAVNVAARMVALAKARQILTTEKTVLALSREAQTSVRRIDTTMLKGKREELDIYEVIWEQQDVTVMMQDPLAATTLKARLKLRLSDHTLELDRNSPIATMGRHRDNDLVVDDILASRTHARIEYRRGRFILLDKSTNGTYLHAQGEESVCLRRDEHPLQGSGVIGLGRPLDADSPLAIHYSCEY
jgi:adenylate cyclase